MLPSLEFNHQDSSVTYEPTEDNQLIINARICFPKPIGMQEFTVNITPETYLKDISWARTFLRTDIGHLINFNPYLIDDFNENGEVFWEYIIKAIRGLPIDPLHSDVLCYQDNEWIKSPRMHDEPVRHKILDVIGDLSLLNQRLQGKFTFVFPGHNFNQALCSKLYYYKKEMQIT